MKFTAGDRIVLKQTGEEGFVVAWLNDQMLEVEVNHTVFPVYKDDIDHPYLRWFTDKKKQQQQKSTPEQLPVEQPRLPASRLATGIYLSFMPIYMAEAMEDIVSSLKIFLVNELPCRIHYDYEVTINGQLNFRHQGSLEPFAHVYLHHIPYESVNDKPAFGWTVSDADISLGLRERQGVLRLKPVKFFEKISAAQINNDPSFSFLLTETLDAASVPPPLPEVTDPVKPVPAVQRKKDNRHFGLRDLPRYEIDLHIEHVTEHIQGLSNADMLHLQLDYLKRYLRLAISHKLDKVIVIHGLGKGVLKEAVHRVLKETAEVGNYVNEWHGSYGFGATQVYFKYW